MYRTDKYRIVTNGKKFRVQKLNKFLGIIKRWSFDSGASFRFLYNARLVMEQHKRTDQILKEFQEERRQEEKRPWIPVEKEN